LIGLALLSIWEACSRSYNVSGAAFAGFPYEILIRDSSDAKISYSFIVRGGPDDDPEGILSNLIPSLDSGEMKLGAIAPVVLRSDGLWKGIRVREEADGSIIIRTLWMRADTTGSTVLARDPWTIDLLNSVLRGGYDPGNPPKTISTDIAVETTYSLGPDSITFYRHITSEYPGLYAFEGHTGDVPQGWEVVEIDPPSPLW
jgi:hypothetical protein